MSTISKRPCSFAISAISFISVTSIVGLLGVSIKIALVFSFIALSTFSFLVVSTYVNVLPRSIPRVLKSLVLPPYISSCDIILSPALKSSNTNKQAAIPVDVATVS